MAASRALTSGTMRRLIFRPRASMAMGSAPRTPRRPPSSDKFADKKRVGNLFLVQAAVGAQDAERHGQVEAGAFLADVGGRQVDGDVGGRNVVAAVLQRRADAVAAFAHRGVGQADGVKVVFVLLDAGDVDLDLNDVGVDAVDGGTQGLVEHRGTGKHTKEALRKGDPFRDRSKRGTGDVIVITRYRDGTCALVTSAFGARLGFNLAGVQIPGRMICAPRSPNARSRQQPQAA